MKESVAPITWNLPVLTLAVGVAGLGMLSLLSQDFGFQWQPVSRLLPNRAEWATATGVAEILIALALVIPASRTLGAVAVTSLYAFWSALHTPAIIEHPLNVGAMLGAAEPFAIAMAALALALAREGGAALVDVCVRAFGAACIVFGASHFAYADFTAAMVPQWLPEPLIIAYLTGAIHTGCGLALLVGFNRSIAAAIEASMMTSFVALVHVPRVVTSPSYRLEWTMLLAALLLSASAWIVTVESGLKRSQ
jgi:uncharacterized membrane protein